MYASYNCNTHPWLHEVRSGNRTFLVSWRGFLQGFEVILFLGFISKLSITWNHKGSSVRWSREAWRCFFFFRSWERRTAPMNVGCIKISWYASPESNWCLRNSQRSARSSVGFDIPWFSCTTYFLNEHMWYHGVCLFKADAKKSETKTRDKKILRLRK